MREDWQYMELTEVVDRFIVPQRDKPKVFDGDIPWCRIEDFDGKYLYTSKSDKAVSKDLIESMPLRVFPKDTVIVSCSADLGRCAIIGQPLVTNQTFIGLVPIKEKLNPEYLYYLMGSKAAELNSMASGATIKYLSKKKFQSLKIPVPVLSEQKQIVAILDKALAAIDQAKANIEKNIQNAEELFQSKLRMTFLELFDKYEIKNIGDLLKTSAGGTPLKRKKEYYEGGDIPWLLSGEVGQRYITKSSKFITDLGLQNSSAKIYPMNSVLVAMYGATAGEVGILRFPASSNQAVCAIYPDKNISEEFLYYYFIYIKQDLIAQAVGNAQPNISQKKIKDLKLPILPLDLQKKIVNQIKEFEFKTREYKYAKSLIQENLSELKSSILQNAFSGKLTSSTVSKQSESLA